VIGFVLFSIQLNTFNPRYTQFELAFRFFFLISAIVTTVRWLSNRTQWNLLVFFSVFLQNQCDVFLFWTGH